MYMNVEGPQWKASGNAVSLLPMFAPPPFYIYGEGEREEEEKRLTDSPLLCEVVMDKYQQVPPPVLGTKLLLGQRECG